MDGLWPWIKSGLITLLLLVAIVPDVKAPPQAVANDDAIGAVSSNKEPSATDPEVTSSSGCGCHPHFWFCMEGFGSSCDCGSCDSGVIAF